MGRVHSRRLGHITRLPMCAFAIRNVVLPVQIMLHLMGIVYCLFELYFAYYCPFKSMLRPKLFTRIHSFSTCLIISSNFAFVRGVGKCNLDDCGGLKRAQP